MQSPSRIFAGYRALGYVSNHVPLVLRCNKERKESYILTCVGKAFHTYNCSKLGITTVSDSLEDDILCLAANERFVFAGCGNVIYAFSRGKKVVHTYRGHKGNIDLLLPFGSHLVSATADELFVWDIDSEETYMQMRFDFSTMRISAIVHPASYTNKILVGTMDGFLQLWNIKEDKLLHMFQGWGQAVMTLTQSPAADVIAVGLEDGTIVLHNFRTDETLMRFKQDWGAVTAISFRTDGPPIMITGSLMGHIAVWDLEERRIRCQMRDAHKSAVCGLHCLPGEPLMVTNSADNTLKVWIFDMSDGSGRVLRERAGHAAPPSQIRFYGDTSQTILSAGQDSVLRSFSTVHEKHDKSLGRASFNKKASKRSGLKHDRHKMPFIIHFAAEPARASDWDSVVACHQGLAEVTSWSVQRSTMGRHHLLHPRFHQDWCRDVEATCVDITSCANFVLIGYTSGHVDKFNLESGIHRGAYGIPTAHASAVRGVAVDSLNQLTITAGGEGDLKFWHFKRLTALKTVAMATGINQIFLHRASGMLGVSLDDFSVCVVDTETRTVVRIFSGHTNCVTDMAFSPDGRWLVTASMDCSLRTWDMPSARLIDCFLVDNAVSSMSLSPVGDFLATSHVDDLGIYLWSNRTLFARVALMPLPPDFQPQTASLPQARGHDSEEDVTELEGEREMEEKFASAEQLGDQLITLALLPESRWKNLLNLDVIKRRNKPKEPPRRPDKVPFLLPTLPGLEPKFLPAEKPQQIQADVSDADRLQMMTSNSAFAKCLLTADKEKNYDKAVASLMEMVPSAVDVELRSMDPGSGGDPSLLAAFLRLILHLLKRRSHFELAQSQLGLFLKIHGEFLTSDPQLVELVREVSIAQDAAWSELDSLLNSFPCLINYCKSATLSS